MTRECFAEITLDGGQAKFKVGIFVDFTKLQPHFGLPAVRVMSESE